MVNAKITDLTALTAVADNDLMEIVDVSDTTMSSTGTNKKITKANLVAAERAALAAQKDVTETLTNKTLSTNVKLDANADSNITYYGMARQAIMNGNFDVWQRGTSTTLSDATVTYQADRWYDYNGRDGGTLPTLTRSRQMHTSGDIVNSIYFTRLTINGAGTSLGVNSEGELTHKIENGTAKLCGLSKKVTVSFWARSSITNKRICPTLWQNYGTGGSPSADEFILGTPITLTSTWTKYIATFTTNTLVGKTFGSNGDDHLALQIWYMWGVTKGNTRVQAGVTAETYVGAGNIDIAQVQLCAGDVALPFQPKSFEEELRACQRYYERLASENVAFPSDTYTAAYRAYNYSTITQAVSIPVFFKVTKRTTPNGTAKVRYDIQDGSAATGDMTNPTPNGFWFGASLSVPAGQYVDLHDWEASAEL